MAKYDVTHACGHSQEHQLFGSHRDRDRKLSWLATVPCGACARAEREQQKIAAAKAAAKSSEAIGLPALIGSEKEIAWANQIRLEKLADADASIANLRARMAQPIDADRPELQERLAAIIEMEAGGHLDAARAWIASQPMAKWWIDQREKIGAALLLLAPCLLPYLEAIAPDVAAARRAEMERVAREADHAARRPRTPACVFAGAPQGARWNRRIYSGRRIFVGGKEKKLSAEEEAEVRAYISAIEAWEKEGLACATKS